MLLSNTENRVVITTNFDTLLEDALYTYTCKHPLVVGHETLASYTATDARHPVIAKVHRDLLFRPLNRETDMEKLASEWERPLRNVLSQYIPIVIGYAGGDHTVMSLLQSMELNGIYWCHLGESPSEVIQSTVAKQNGYLVRILGFDEIMFQLGERFSQEATFHEPCQHMREQTEKRYNLYQTSLEKIKGKYDATKTETLYASPPKNGEEDMTGIIDAIERYNSRLSGEAEASGELKELLHEAQAKTLLGLNEEALKLYTKVIGQAPGTAEYYKSEVLSCIG